MDRIERAGALRVGTPGDYRPYADSAGPVSTPLGSDIAIARAVAASLGVGIEFVSTSWGTLTDDTGATRFDAAVGGISITAERRQVADFSRPLARDGKTVLAPCATLSNVDTLAELNRAAIRVIVNPGGTNERFARSRLPRATLIVHTDNRTVFDELIAGRADAMITDAVEARLQARLHPQMLCAAHPDHPFDRADKAILLARDPALVARVDARLRELQRDGSLKRSLARWIDYPWQLVGTPQGDLLALVDARLAVMSDVARTKWNSGAAIEDPVREAELLQGLVDEGGKLGVPGDRVRVFFDAQFAAARRLQHDLHDVWRAQRRDKLPPAPDLRQDIRPRLDRVSAAMLKALAAWPRDTTLPSSATLTTALVSPAAAELALAPLRAAQ